MKKTQNYAAAIALVVRYRTITLDEIKKVWEGAEGNHERVINILTGFGNPFTCTLCIESHSNCDRCIYVIPGFGFGCICSTYNAIQCAHTPDQLLEAYRARAEYIKKVVNKRRKKTIIQ